MKIIPSSQNEKKWLNDKKIETSSAKHKKKNNRQLP